MGRLQAALASLSTSMFWSLGIKEKEIESKELLNKKISWRIPWISTAEPLLDRRSTRLFESEKHSSFRSPEEEAAIRAVFTARASAIKAELMKMRFVEPWLTREPDDDLKSHPNPATPVPAIHEASVKHLVAEEEER